MTASVLVLVASVAAVATAGLTTDGARRGARRHPGRPHAQFRGGTSTWHPRPAGRAQLPHAPDVSAPPPLPRSDRQWEAARPDHTEPSDPTSRHAGASLPRMRTVALATAVLLPLAPPVAVLVPPAVWLHRRRRALMATRRTQGAVRRALPDVVDLLLLTTSAGLSLPLAHPLVAVRVDAPVAGALRAAAAEAAAGRPRADALVDALTPLGPGAARVGHALADHLRYGTPLAPALERLSADLRLERRREAEQEARRVPVRLLGPLVACVLPAFALLTVVPLLAASLRALPA